MTLNMFDLPPFVAVCSCSWRRASWYVRLIGLKTGGGSTGCGFQRARALITAAVSSSESTGAAFASSSSATGAFASRAASAVVRIVSF